MGRYLRRLRAHQRKRVRDFSEGRISTAIGKVPSTSPMMYEQEEVTRRFNPFDIRSYEKLRNLIDTTVFSSPSRTAIASFFLVIVFFTVTLSLPISSVTGKPAPFHHAFFTATSAVTVTGLTTVSTAAQWSVFGQVMILLACQIGGLGALTMTSLLALAIGRKMGLRSKLIAQEELSIGRLGEVGSVLRTVAYTSIGIESTIVLAPVSIAVFLGALGFPVLMTIQQKPFRPRDWTLTTKLTVTTTSILFALGALLWGIAEWANPRTIGNYGAGEKILSSIFASIMTRSGGFNLVDMNDIRPVTGLITDVLMFIGGGSASTAGGVKVTTIAVIMLAIIAEARGDQFVMTFGRTIPVSALRIAISVTMMSTGIVLVGTGVLLAITDQPLVRVLFEVISAYATCGLSNGLSTELPPSGIYVLSLLMFIGRIGTITAATGLALRSRRRLYKYPEERPVIG